MTNIIHLLLEDNLVKTAIRKRPKLNRHVQYFLNNGHRQLIGEHGSNCIYTLNSALVPALLAYDNCLSRNGDLFSSGISPHSKKRCFFVRKTSYNDIGIAFNFICGLIEKAISDLQIGVDSISIPEENKVDRLLYAIVKEYGTSALRRNRSDLASFWVLASCYYKNTPDFSQPLMPTADNLLQVIPFDVNEVKRLEALAKNRLDRFCTRHKVINAMGQDNTKKEESGGLENSVFYTNPEITYNTLQFATKCNFPDAAKDELARDLYSFSLSIESWENLLYFSSETHVLEYLPRNIAYYYTIVKIYEIIFRIINSGEVEVELLTESINHCFNFYMSSIHLFLPSIYERDGNITESAEYLLAGFRAYKRNSPLRLISQRGSNIWQRGIAGDARRIGKKFW